MRVGGLILGLVVLLLGALWFRSVDEPEDGLTVAPPTTSAPRAVTSPSVVTSTEPLEPSPLAQEEDEEEPAPKGRMPKCRPTLRAGDGPPLELTLTGADLPAAPPKSMFLEVRWTEEGQPRRWYVQLTDWKAAFWLCDESEVAMRRGPYRLRSQRVPRSGPVSFFLEKPAAPSEVTVRTVRRGAPVAGVRVSLTGCEPLVTGDGGVVVTSCEEVEEPRRAVVRAPWRSATLTSIAPNATEVTLSVLGRDEVEPGRVGLGFAQGATTPVVGVLMNGGPAQRAGVKVGDEVLEVDGAGVSTVEETMPRIIGAPGTTVRFKLRRGQDVLLLDVVRVE
ncbi:MAG: PDZ domain-containing protein [Archangium sp.]|nr:PDZ domain-containing protein [Archangium sp.]